MLVHNLLLNSVITISPSTSTPSCPGWLLCKLLVKHYEEKSCWNMPINHKKERVAIIMCKLKDLGGHGFIFICFSFSDPLYCGYQSPEPSIIASITASTWLEKDGLFISQHIAKYFAFKDALLKPSQNLFMSTRANLNVKFTELPFDASINLAGFSCWPLVENRW